MDLLSAKAKKIDPDYFKQTGPDVAPFDGSTKSAINILRTASWYGNRKYSFSLLCDSNANSTAQP
jgi:hypothetical protein